MILASSIWFTSKNTSVCLEKVVHACTEPEKLILRLILRLSCHWIILLKIGESVEESLVHPTKKSNNSYWSHSNMCIQHKSMYSLFCQEVVLPKLLWQGWLFQKCKYTDICPLRALIQSHGMLRDVKWSISCWGHDVILMRIPAVLCKN